jgi:hypothetical protein
MAAVVLLATFVVGGVLVPAVHAVHHARGADTTTHTHVVQSDADSSIDCTLCEAVFHSAHAASISAPTPTLHIRAWEGIAPASPHLHLAGHHVIRGPPHA